MRLSSFNPVSILFGPIFQKEVRTSGRRRATYIFRALYTLGLLVLVGVAFEGLRNTASIFSGVQRLQNLQQLAPQLALIIVWFQFVALALAAPIFTGPCICDEKRARTLSALLTTPMTAAQIVYGKLASRIVQLVILGLLATPMLLAIRVFGGLNAEVVLAAAAISISTAILGAALGLMYSTWHTRATSAAVFAILTLVLLQAAPTVIEGILYYSLNEIGIGTGRLDYEFHENIMATCSPAALAMITAQAAMGGELPVVSFSSSWATWILGKPAAGIVILGPTWVLNSIHNLLIAVAVTLYSTSALRRIMLKEAATEGGASSAGRSRRKRKRDQTKATLAAAPGSADPAAQAADRAELPESPPAAANADDDSNDRDARTVADNPVLWREVRQATFGSRRKFSSIAGLAVAGLLFLYWRAGLGEEGLHAALAVVGAIAVMIQPVFMTTGSIAGEREARTWDVLLSTPMTARAILIGKMAGALRMQWFLPTLILVHFLITALAGYASLVLIAQLLLIFAGPVLFFTATGQLMSLIFRKSTTAAVCNLLLAMLIWMGSWVGVGLAAWFLDLDNHKTLDYAGAVLYSINPVAMAISAADGGVRYTHGFWGGGNYSLLGETFTMRSGRFTLITAGVFAAYALGAFYAFSLAAMVFPRMAGRSWSPRQKSEEGMAAIARIVSALIIVLVAIGLGYTLGHELGAVTGLVAASGFLAYRAVQRRIASAAAPDQGPVDALAGDVGHDAPRGGVAHGDQ